MSSNNSYIYYRSKYNHTINQSVTVLDQLYNMTYWWLLSISSPFLWLLTLKGSAQLKMVPLKSSVLNFTQR